MLPKKKYEKPKGRSPSKAARTEIFKLLPLVEGFTEGVTHEILSTVYKIADIYYNDVIKPDAVCKSGCSHCCKIPVQVSIVEAAYIQEKTGAKANDLLNNSVRAPAQAKNDCPFLVNDNCSIYEYRPFHCRLFATYDSAVFCAAGGHVSHYISNYTASQLTIYLCDFIGHISKPAAKQHGLAEIADIRDWFNPQIIGVKNV